MGSRARSASIAGVAALVLGLVAPASARVAVGEPLAAAALGVAEVAEAADPPAPGGPVAGARVRPVPGEVVRGFDPPATPYGPGHRGVDLAAPGGSEVVVVADGTVVFTGVVAGVGWVSVDHGPRLRTTYGPLVLRTVTRGQAVRAGQRLGWLDGEAAHLDWGARLDGEYIDPMLLLRRWRPVLVALDAGAPARAGAAEGLPAGPVVADGAGNSQAGVSAAAALSARLTRWPASGRISSPFGPRTHPVTGLQRLHAGLDIAAPTGTPVTAAGAGTVVAVGWRGGYGRTVDVDHGGGLATRSAHLSSADVRVGQRVAAGQRLGAVGCTGTCTGPHLHFEVRLRGVPVDPHPHLP